MVIILLPKGNGKYRGIGLIEPFQKVIQVIVSERLGVIGIHDCLHGFMSNRGMVTAILELKLAQQLAYLEQEALFSTFIDVKKAYGAMD